MLQAYPPAEPGQDTGLPFAVGVATALLAHIMAEAERRGYRQLSLETGSMAYFEPAHRLYCKSGFHECPPFAGYVAGSALTPIESGPREHPKGAKSKKKQRSILTGGTRPVYGAGAIKSPMRKMATLSPLPLPGEG